MNAKELSFGAYRDEINKIIYATIGIEPLNSMIEKNDKNRRIFFKNAAFFKMIYRPARQASNDRITKANSNYLRARFSGTVIVLPRHTESGSAMTKATKKFHSFIENHAEYFSADKIDLEFDKNIYSIRILPP